jgi:hypothetical protein
MTYCSVPNCGRPAVYEAFLYDVYTDRGNDQVFHEEDYTCRFLCSEHMIENEEQSRGERKPRGYVKYPHTNREGAQGFTIYYPLEETPG